MIILAVDPGITRPAIAIINDRFGSEHVYTCDFRVLKGALDFPFRLEILRQKVQGFIDRNYTRFISAYDRAFLVIEQPEHHNSLKGKKAEERGDIVKLSMTAGLFFTLFSGAHNFESRIFLTPSKWKGQVPKSVTRSRMEQLYGSDVVSAKMSDDEVDALGLASFLYESINNKPFPARKVSKTTN